MSSFAKPVVVTIPEWNPSAIKYMAPKINDRGGKSINMISKQTNRSLHISTPLMMTWGISDFVDEKGDSDGKYSMSLNFPNEEYKSKATDEFLTKLKDFENQLLDDAVVNSELWWGEEMSREVAKHTFFPFIKYTKNKDTKKIDPTKPPSIRAKVPNYNGKWGVEIYDTKSNLLFPCEIENLTPIDFVPKMSNVACVLQCGGIWIGGKGWGLTWKLIQCVVKPREVVSVYGKCHIQLSVEDQETIATQEIVEDVQEEDVVETVSKETESKATESKATVSKATESKATESKATVSKPQPIQTQVEDSDDEDPAAVSEAAPEVVPVVQEELPPKPVKKIVKKPVEVAVQEAEAEVAVQEAEPVVVKKKIVKKKVP